MILLPEEIIFIIFDRLPIPDKRNLLRCSKKFDIYKNTMPKYERAFVYQIVVQYPNVSILNLSRLQRYTLEMIYHSYIINLPSRYIQKNNAILYDYPEIYYDAGFRNLFDLVKLLMSCNKNYIQYLIQGATDANHTELLNWVKKEGKLSKMERFKKILHESSNYIFSTMPTGSHIPHHGAGLRM